MLDHSASLGLHDDFGSFMRARDLVRDLTQIRDRVVGCLQLRSSFRIYPSYVVPPVFIFLMAVAGIFLALTPVSFQPITIFLPGVGIQTVHGMRLFYKDQKAKQCYPRGLSHEQAIHNVCELQLHTLEMLRLPTCHSEML